MKNWEKKLILIGAVMTITTSSQAQLYWGSGKVLQNEQHVGQFFREAGPKGACEYTEVWYLEPNFHYVGGVSGSGMELVPISHSQLSKKEFLASVELNFPKMKGKFVTSHMIEPYGHCGDQS